jgi:hypothetical protein
MSESLIERLTSDFYQWERMGRGWNAYPEAVDLEPPFYPFFFHALPQVSVIDDGKRPTVFSRLATLLSSSSSSITTEKPIEKKEAPEPFPYICESPLTMFSVSLPKGFKVKADVMEQLLVMLSFCEAPLSFEIIGNGSFIRVQFVCREIDAVEVRSHIKSFFPEVTVEDRTNTQYDILAGDHNGYVLELGLKDEFMRPLETAGSFDTDPLIGLFAVLDSLQEGEQGVAQIQFKAAINPWSESIIRSVTDDTGGSFFLDAPEMVSLAKEKIASPLYAVTIRVIGQSIAEGDRHFSIAKSLGNALINVSKSSGNRLIQLSSEGYPKDMYYDDIVLRQSHRLGMLLNSGELATLVHFPSQSIVSSKLERDIRKTKAAPSITEGHDFIIGKNIHQGKERNASFSSEQRLKHTHIIGATGTGKSTLLLNLIASDAKLGNGIAVLDPHGDLIENVIPHIPRNRLNDVIIIDPSDSEYPVGFNVLTAHSDIEKEILSSDLVAAFKRLSTSWGDQMNSVFANAILAFLEGDSGYTLIDLRRFLIEKSFRDSYLKTVSDPNIVYYWQKEFPLLKSGSIGPILTRLDIFLRPKLIRHMVAQKKSIGFEDVLNSKKILLVKLSQGLIGAENSYMLGTFIVSKIHQAAMARQIKKKEERNNFYLYIDEFQNFITPSMASILSGARKYHLGLILAHQDMQQLVKQDGELASSVVANAGTRICFRVGDADARKFEDGFSFFDAKDLQNLETGQAIVRVDRPEFDFNIEINPMQAFDNGTVQTISHYVVSTSRERYGTPKGEVEKALKDIQSTLIQDRLIEVKAAVSMPEPTEQNKILPTTPVNEIKSQETISSLVQRKEQSEHRYIQSLIKRMAESRGFKASIEEVTPDGKGRVDILLERNGKRIACEVALTTTDQWEVHNVEKCIRAGYETVVVCSNDRKNLEKIQKKINETIDVALLTNILLLQPEALFLYLDQQIAKEASKEERIKGYRVKVEYDAIPEGEAEQKKINVLRAISNSLRSSNDR